MELHDVRVFGIPLRGSIVDPKKQNIPRGPRVVNGGYVDHVVDQRGGRSIEAAQVHRHKLWDVVAVHASTVVDEVVSNTQGLTVADISGGAAVGIVLHVQREWDQGRCSGLFEAGVFGKIVNGNVSSHLD